jgi:2-polyprenyl-3-methyl-5-hydroxy-6-metoxy-1,4-benzoquinol methylase
MLNKAGHKATTSPSGGQTEDSSSALYSCWGKVPSSGNRKRVEQTLNLIPADIRTILDLGCGDGMVSNRLIEKGFEVTGVDTSIEAIRFFKGKKVVTSIDCLPFPDQSFDLILCTEALEHLPDGVYERTLREIERVAKKYVVISTPNEEYLPAGLAKCSACKQVFHVSLHLKTFDKTAHKKLFGGLKWIKTIKSKSSKYSPLVTSVKHRLGIYSWNKGLLCPGCGNKIDLVKIGTGKKLLVGCVKLLVGIIPRRRKAKWIISLFSRY